MVTYGPHVLITSKLMLKVWVHILTVK
jgi:hypothetical protein